MSIPNDSELPGMWEKADLIGGATDCTIPNGLLLDICGNCGGTFQLEQMAAFIPPCWYCKTCTEKFDTCSFCNQSFPNDNADTPPTDRYWADSEHTCCKKCLGLEALALCKICKQPKLIENMAFGICEVFIMMPHIKRFIRVINRENI